MRRGNDGEGRGGRGMMGGGELREGWVGVAGWAGGEGESEGRGGGGLEWVRGE